MEIMEFSTNGEDIFSKIEINGEVFYGDITDERSVHIPFWIFAHKDLSDRAIRIWGYLKGAVSGAFDIPGTSHTALADLLNVSETTARRAIYELREAGAITVQPRFKNGKQVKNAYYLWPAEPVDLTPTRVSTGDEGEHTRSAVYNNNIDINISKEQPVKRTRKKRVVNTYPEEFAQIWKIYPRKLGKPKAFEVFNETLSDGKTTFEDLLTATINYAEERKGKAETYTLHASTFFGGSGKWQAYLYGCAPDVEKFVMTDELLVLAEIYDSYDLSGVWKNPTTGETSLDNPIKNGYSRPVNNLEQTIDKNGTPYALDSASGKRKNI
jgi:DNA-binding Lrp family transcriptional regulator